MRRNQSVYIDVQDTKGLNLQSMSSQEQSPVAHSLKSKHSKSPRSVASPLKSVESAELSKS